jgi:hypothetical protein
MGVAVKIWPKKSRRNNLKRTWVGSAFFVLIPDILFVRSQCALFCSKSVEYQSKRTKKCLAVTFVWKTLWTVLSVFGLIYTLKDTISDRLSESVLIFLGTTDQSALLAQKSEKRCIKLSSEFLYFHFFLLIIEGPTKVLNRIL